MNAKVAFFTGRTALQAAAGAGHLEVVERLLTAKADVNAEAAIYCGRTALEAATQAKHLEVVERLLTAKVARVSVARALRGAKEYGVDEKIIKILESALWGRIGWQV